MSQLDLTRHSIDEIPGKTIELNGAGYRFLDLADEGGTTFIYPLENIQTGIVLFLAKISKFVPGSSEYARAVRGGSNGFVLSLSGVDTEHEELYEPQGCILRLQLHKSGVFLSLHGSRAPTPLPITERMHYSDLVAAQSHMDQMDYDSAIQVLNDVLSLNPDHSLALLMLAGTYFEKRQPNVSVHALRHALIVEPNDTRLHHLLIDSYSVMGRYDRALDAVNVALGRYSLDWGAWERKRDIATRFALSEILLDSKESLLEILSGTYLGHDNASLKSEIGDDFDTRIIRAKESETLRAQAQQIHATRDWRSAGEAWQKFSKTGVRDALSDFNQAVCRFHLGERRELAADFVQLSFSLPELRPECLLLATISFEEGNDAEQATRFAEALVDALSTSDELPGIAWMVNLERDEAGALALSASYYYVGCILSTLETLARREHPKAASSGVAALYSRYQALLEPKTEHS